MQKIAIKLIDNASSGFNQSGNPPFLSNHGAPYFFNECTRGLFNVWDKVQCAGNEITVHAFNKSAITLNIDGTLNNFSIPGSGMVNGVWFGINNVIDQNMTIFLGNQTTNATLKFINMSVWDFVNLTGQTPFGQQDFFHPIMNAAFADPTVGGMLGAAVMIGSMVSLGVISLTSPETFKEIHRDIKSGFVAAREKIVKLKSVFRREIQEPIVQTNS